MSGQMVCGCGHRVTAHARDRCLVVWRYPDVLNARPCGCKGVWKPGPEDSRYGRRAEQERAALVAPSRDGLSAGGGDGDEC